MPLTLYARVDLPRAGWTTVGPIQFMAGERKYLSWRGWDLTSDNRHFYLFAHVQGNPDVVVLRGQGSDPDDRDYEVFGRTRRFQHFRDEANVWPTDAWVDCDRMVFDAPRMRQVALQEVRRAEKRTRRPWPAPPESTLRK